MGNPDERKKLEIQPHDYENEERTILRVTNDIVDKLYFADLDSCSIVAPEERITVSNLLQQVCVFPITKIVYDKNEDTFQKMTSIFASAAAIDAKLAYILHGCTDGRIELYLGVCGEQNRVNGAFPKAEAVKNNFLGNFPGCRDNNCRMLNNDETRRMLNLCFDKRFRAVSAVTCIPSIRAQQMIRETNGYYQGIEEFIEAMNGKEFTLIALANPLSEEEVGQIINELELHYAQLSPFAKQVESTSKSEALSTSETRTKNLSSSITNSRSHSLSVGTSKSSSVSISGGINGGIGRGMHASVGVPGLSAGGSVNTHLGLSLGIGGSKTWGSSENTTDGTSSGISVSISDSDAKGKSITISNGKSLQLNYENKHVLDLLDRMNKVIGRLRAGKSIGLFASCAYVMAPSLADSRAAAAIFRSCITGDNTSLETSSINSWCAYDRPLDLKEIDGLEQGESATNYDGVISYLRSFRHPCFQYKGNQYQDVTPATLLTSPELAIEMSIPQRSVNGISVRESVSFGRNIFTDFSRFDSKQISIGNIYHLGHTEVHPVNLNLPSMAMHTFVSGTNGSGKSNTIYQIIDSIKKTDPSIHYMVIEPAKGEYKKVLPAVQVYGTNPHVSQLLRINPFRFKQPEVHVLEHIDRLISILNVCWPMEAAMPAIMKQAVERAYQAIGWNLPKSENQYSNHLFPTFTDVMCQVENIMTESDYSADSKGDYRGALCTRLRELTTGLNRMIFVCDDLTDEELFENDVIVDLSRIGSAETKALIMGILVAKLQEYRMGVSNVHENQLRHITILEEAHHLLKRSESGNNSSSGNLVGKSVEMQANAIAEMRSSGEGFIIVDQSPGLLDMAVVRNTNTKIILRLPAQEDRELLGKSMGLNERQIMELAKLPTGIAAVYQNDWLECVLASIHRYSPMGSANIHLKPDQLSGLFIDTRMLLHVALYPERLKELLDVCYFKAWAVDKDLETYLGQQDIPSQCKLALLKYCKEEYNDENLLNVMFALIDNALIKRIKNQIGDPPKELPVEEVYKQMYQLTAPKLQDDEELFNRFGMVILSIAYGLSIEKNGWYGYYKQFLQDAYQQERHKESPDQDLCQILSRLSERMQQKAISKPSTPSGEEG